MHERLGRAAARQHVAQVRVRFEMKRLGTSGFLYGRRKQIYREMLEATNGRKEVIKTPPAQV